MVKKPRFAVSQLFLSFVNTGTQRYFSIVLQGAFFGKKFLQ